MGFKFALWGITDALESERNLRIHFAVASLIVLFALVYNITSTQWAILIMDIAFVFTAELFNTAIEKAVDTATTEWKRTAMIAKDAAAGGVLIAAAASIAVGVCLFGNIPRIMKTLNIIFTTPSLMVLGIVMVIADILLIIGGKNVE